MSSITKKELDSWKMDFFKLKKSKRNWKHAFFQLLFLVTLITAMTVVNTYDVDESTFCKNKINLNFPEYSIEHASFNDKDTCVANVKMASEERRDGLILESNETKELRFKLVSWVPVDGPFGREYVESPDLKFLESDNNINGWMALLGAIGLLGTIITAMSWKGVEF